MKFSVIAKKLSSIGLLPIPVKKNKSSIIKWGSVTLASVNDDYIKAFDDEQVFGIAIVAGQKSGNLECIDIDSKYDLDGSLYQVITDAIIDKDPELYSKLVIVSTPSGGYHMLYRSRSVRRNTKLAMRYQTESEMSASGGSSSGPGQQVLIETRGEGGYFLCWPSPGYTFLKGGFADIQEISEAESAALMEICRSLDQVKAKVDPVKASMGQEKVPAYEPPPSVSRSTKYLKKPWDEYNDRSDVISLLMSHGWTVVRNIPSPDDGRIVTYLKRPGITDKDVSATYNHVPGRVYCFTSSTSLPINTPLTPFEVYVRLQHDGKVKAAVEAVESMGYGVRLRPPAAQPAPAPAPLAEDGRNNMSRILARTPEVLRGVSLSTWWDVELTERKNGTIKKDLHISQSRLVSWLNDKGLRKMHSGGKYDFYMIDGCVCDPVTRADIACFVRSFISTLPDRFDFITPPELLESFVRGSDTYLSAVRLEMVVNISEDEFVRDIKSESYIPFKNGVLKITSSKIELVPYSKFHRLVWRSSIKDIEFKISPTPDVESHDFTRFLFNISSRSLDRYRNLQQLVGYMLSTHKDPGNPAAVILMDQKLTDNSDGGTGKGILVKGMSYVRSTVYEDGKMANKKNQSEFRFSRVTKDTNVIHLSDIEKGFDFEAMFTLITEGLPLNKKFRDEEFIPYSRSPKIIISTNYSVGGRGHSHDRRRIEFELPSHYNKGFTPVDEFGRPLFDSWSDQEWVTFYNIMAGCIMAFLANGMPSFKGINIEARKFIAETSSEFVAWFNIVFGTIEHVSEFGPKSQGKFLFSRLYQEYLDYSALERSETRPSRFIKFLQAGCRHVSLDMVEASEQKDPYSKSLERYILITDPKIDAKAAKFDDRIRLKT